MVYQNNNNRITPNATEDRNLKPAATAQNKLVQYQPDLTRANNWNNNAKALASIGQGFMDIETLWQREKDENVIKAIWETKEENRKDWKEVSKHIKGAAKFNPYNDDAFRKLQAQDFYTAAALELSTYPELGKLNNEAFHQLVNDKTKQMMEAFKQAKLSPKDYGDALVQWDDNMKTLEVLHATEHAKYNFDELITKEISNGADNIEAAMMEAEAGTEVAVFRKVLDDKIAHLENETGIVAADTQAKIIMGNIKTYIARNANQIDDAEILAAISDFRLGDGRSLSEVVPNYSIMVKDLCSQAREANLRQMKLELEVKDFKQEQMIREVMTDFMDKYKKGELSSPDELQAYAAQMTQQYNLDGINSMKLFKDIAAGTKTWRDLADVETDPRTAALLGMKVIAGTATCAEINQAIADGKLNYKDGFHMMQNMQAAEQKLQTAQGKRVQTHIKETTKEFLEGYHTGDRDQDAVLLDPIDQQDFSNDMAQIVSEYESDKDYQAFNDKLAKLKSSYKQALKEQEQSTGIKYQYDTLKRTPFINQAQWNQSSADINESTEALKQMGLIKNSAGWNDSSVGVASAPQQHRKITVTEKDKNGKEITYTKDTRHTGYDLKGRWVFMGREVFAPMSGSVVGVLTEAQSGGMGNMVLVRCDNGKLIKYMHLQHSDLIQLGARVTNKTPIGRIGNTGAVEDKSVGSLHVEFYDENMQWITAKQFVNG